MLGTFVVLYLFLGGCGAAALFVTAVWSLLFHRTETRTFQQSRAFWDLAGKLYLASFGLLASCWSCARRHRCCRRARSCCWRHCSPQAAWQRFMLSAGLRPHGRARGWKRFVRCWRRC